MAFINDNEGKDWKGKCVYDPERGAVMKHKYPGQGMNSQSYIELELHWNQRVIPFHAYFSSPKKLAGQGHDIRWAVKLGDISVDNPMIRSLISDALISYGFLYEALPQESITVSFEAIPSPSGKMQ